MNKKLIIMAGIIGLVGFGGTFAFAWFTKQTPPIPVPNPATANAATELNTEQLESGSASPSPLEISAKKSMTEKQLKGLIYEIRSKIIEYDQKIAGVELQEKRLAVAQETLQKDISHLNDLRVDLTSTVAKLKAEQDNLMKSKIEIAKIEKKNLNSIAATYDKMDAASAGTILTNIVQSQARNANPDDAVKILYYMTERTKAKVLASIAETEPGISAYFCQKLKRIIEKE